MVTDSTEHDAVATYYLWVQQVLGLLPEKAEPEKLGFDCGNGSTFCWVDKHGQVDYRYFARAAYREACRLAPQFVLSPPSDADLTLPGDSCMTLAEATRLSEFYGQQLRAHFSSAQCQGVGALPLPCDNRTMNSLNGRSDSNLPVNPMRQEECSDAEYLILQEMCDETLRGKRIARLAGYSDSHTRKLLSSMVRRKLLLKLKEGYRRTPMGLQILNKGKKS